MFSGQCRPWPSWSHRRSSSRLELFLITLLTKDNQIPEKDVKYSLEFLRLYPRFWIARLETSKPESWICRGSVKSQRHPNQQLVCTTNAQQQDHCCKCKNPFPFASRHAESLILLCANRRLARAGIRFFLLVHHSLFVFCKQEMLGSGFSQDEHEGARPVVSVDVLSAHRQSNASRFETSAVG